MTENLPRQRPRRHCVCVGNCPRRRGFRWRQKWRPCCQPISGLNWWSGCWRSCLRKRSGMWSDSCPAGNPANERLQGLVRRLLRSGSVIAGNDLACGQFLLQRGNACGCHPRSVKAQPSQALQPGHLLQPGVRHWRVEKVSACKFFSCASSFSPVSESSSPPPRFSDRSLFSPANSFSSASFIAQQ